MTPLSRGLRVNTFSHWRVASQFCHVNTKYSFGQALKQSPKHITAIDLTDSGKTLWTHDFVHPLYSLTTSSKLYIETLESNNKQTEFSLLTRGSESGKVLKKTVLLNNSQTKEEMGGMLMSEDNHIYALLGPYTEDETRLKKIIAVEAKTHKMIFNTSFDMHLVGMPALGYQRIFMMSDRYAYKINANTGNVLSKVSIPHCDDSSPGSCILFVIDQDRVLFFDNQTSEEWHIINFKTQTVKGWKALGMKGKPVIDKEKIYFSDRYHIVAFDKNSLAFKWKYSISGRQGGQVFGTTDNAVVIAEEYDGIHLLSKDGQRLHMTYPINECIMPWAINEKALVCLNHYWGIPDMVYIFRT